MIVKTDETGASSSTQFTLPLVGSLTYNFNIDWGDGNTETVTSSTSPTHTYASAGTYNIRITENTAGGFPSLRFDNGGDRYKLLYINNWGNNTWTTMEKSFRGCGNMQLTAADLPVTGGVTAFQYSFGGCKSITSFPQMNMSSATSVRDMFWQCNNLVVLPLLPTGNVTNWENFVRGCSSLASFPQLDTSSGTNFRGYVRDCSSLTSFPLIDTSSGTDFFWSFHGTTGLSGGDFPLLNFGSASGSTALEKALPAPSLSSYSALLIDIANKNANSGILLSNQGNWNTSANTARDLLIARGWTFAGSGVYTP